MTGMLRWGIKRSLLDYVRRFDGGIVHAGAHAGADGRTVFPADPSAPEEWDGCGVLAAFSGAVQLRAHGGLLALDIAEPWIVLRGDTSLLTIADPDDARGRSGFVVLVDAAPSVEWRGVSATVLTADGADQFLGTYRAGTGFDPVEIG
ncbi:hypothetical protein ASD65_14200 [Microbacterium sp. Root61]|uniref:HtaA domain-containing protein n=1 Tax=Microbacterium sp. Root61 TaxID=1736570 RepID=UPI000700DBE7|nr:HtaA domain-containing protein [Microbacterium sp. Root61]KRA25444.1 hypothetical protein ASD65_14200 [Microbacterium sp. Root61]